MEEILLVNGPNLNMLGTRQPEVYGSMTLPDIEKMVTLAAKKQGYTLKCFQSNSEGEIIDFMQQHALALGVIINPGAFTHYSYAIRDCIKSINTPTVEVHISAIYQREEFRHTSVIAPVCIGQISGFGDFGYLLALQGLIDYLCREEQDSDSDK